MLLCLSLIDCCFVNWTVTLICILSVCSYDIVYLIGCSLWRNKLDIGLLSCNCRDNNSYSAYM